MQPGEEHDGGRSACALYPEAEQHACMGILFVGPVIVESQEVVMIEGIPYACDRAAPAADSVVVLQGEHGWPAVPSCLPSALVLSHDLQDVELSGHSCNPGSHPS